MKIKATAICLTLCALLSLTAGAAGYSFTEGKNVVLLENDIPVNLSGDEYVFVKKLFADIEKGDFEWIRVIELPNPKDGALLSGKFEVVPYQKISKSKLSSLRFVAARSFDGSAIFCFKTVTSDGKESPVYRISISRTVKKTTLSLDSINISTLPLISAAGTLYDSTGSYNCVISKAPKMGTVSLPQNGYYVYLPGGKSGSDSFSFEVLDENAFPIAKGEVKVKIEKPQSLMFFEDMASSYAHLAAIKVSEAGIMSGMSVAGRSFFSPGLLVTRADYLVSLMSAIYEEDIPSASVSGMSDDEQIPVWVKGYVAEAYSRGIINGRADGEGKIFFDANSPVTRAEAVLMAVKALGIDVSETGNLSFTDGDEIPDWAYEAFCAAYETGIIRGYGDGTVNPNKAMTREETAQLMYNIQSYLESQKTSFWDIIDVFGWFK